MKICCDCNKEFNSLKGHGKCIKCYRKYRGILKKEKEALFSADELLEVKRKKFEYMKKYREEHKEELRVSKREYALSNKDKIKKYVSKYYKNLPQEKINRFKTNNKKRSKEWYSKNKDKQAKRYYQNKEKISKEQKEYRIKNSAIVKSKDKKRYERRKQCPLFKLKQKIRGAYKRACDMVCIKKDCPTFKALGITPEQLVCHQEKYINKPCCYGSACGGKTVINHKNNHLDHIKPLAEAKTDEDTIKLNQLDNIQFICGPCNLSKSDKWDGE